jgi:hypothetical protein
MDKLKSMIEDMFLHAQTLEAGSPGVRAVKRHLQQMAGELGFTNLALELRGKIASGEGAGRTGRSALVQTNRASGRFNTKPPEQQVFVNPTTSSPNNAEPAGIEEDDNTAHQDGASEIYAKIAKMTPSQIVSTYGESAIVGMVNKLGGNIDDTKSVNQKAAYLKALIKDSSTGADDKEPIAE